MDINKNCVLGGQDHLVFRLNEPFKNAKSVDIIISFLMESGVRLLSEELNDLLERKQKGCSHVVSNSKNNKISY